MSDPKTIFVFCNNCSRDWHVFTALSEDGHFLTGHVCSSHGFAAHDMGLTSDWKHDVYDAHYPDGWKLEMVGGDVKVHEGINSAYKKHLARPKDDTAESDTEAS